MTSPPPPLNPSATPAPVPVASEVMRASPVNDAGPGPESTRASPPMNARTEGLAVVELLILAPSASRPIPVVSPSARTLEVSRASTSIPSDPVVVTVVGSPGSPRAGGAGPMYASTSVVSAALTSAPLPPIARNASLSVSACGVAVPLALRVRLPAPKEAPSPTKARIAPRMVASDSSFCRSASVALVDSAREVAVCVPVALNEAAPSTFTLASAPTWAEVAPSTIDRVRAPVTPIALIPKKSAVPVAVRADVAVTSSDPAASEPPGPMPAPVVPEAVASANMAVRLTMPPPPLSALACTVDVSLALSVAPPLRPALPSTSASVVVVTVEVELEPLPLTRPMPTKSVDAVAALLDVAAAARVPPVRLPPAPMRARTVAATEALTIKPAIETAPPLTLSALAVALDVPLASSVAALVTSATEPSTTTSVVCVTVAVALAPLMLAAPIPV